MSVCRSCGNGEIETRVDIDKWIRIRKCIQCEAEEVLKLSNDEVVSFMGEKLSLGLFPKRLWQEQRRDAVKEAIIRRMNANKEIPVEWIEEYNEYV